MREISKELVSEVLKTVKNVEHVEDLGNQIFWSGLLHSGFEASGHINIHELAHKCKEYFARLGYVVGNDLDKITIWSVTKRKIVKQYEVYYEDYLEYEFIACEWILEQNKQ